MPQRGQMTTLPQRVEIVERAKAGETDAQIARGLRLSSWTVRKWRRKGEKEGRVGLSPQQGRPATGALGTVSPMMRKTVRELREAHPGWGPLTLRVELEMDVRFTEDRIPSRSRIAAFLRQEKLVRPYERHTKLEEPKKAVSHSSHEEWEMDAQGVMDISGLGQVSLINIGDTFSLLKVACWPCVNCSKPRTPDYQLACRRAFLRYGRPKRISLDHDRVFYNTDSASPFPSHIHLWLIGLGIQVRFIHQPPPAEHAFIERAHQTITKQVITGQTFADKTDCLQAIESRLDFLNQDYPSRSLQGQAPLEAHPDAEHSGRMYDPHDEATLIDLNLIYAYLAKHRWFRLSSSAGQFSLGGHRYGLGKAWSHQTLEITFDSSDQTFVCLSQDGQRTTRVAAQGLTKTDLMGEWPPWKQLPTYQRLLPFFPKSWREDLLYQEMVNAQ